MRLVLPVLILIASASPALADPETWLLAVDRWGNPQYYEATIETEAGVLTGTLGGDPLTGRRAGNRISFSVTDTDGDVRRFEASVNDDRLTGSADYPVPSEGADRVVHNLTGLRLEMPEPGPPRRVEFAPTRFSNEFTAHLEPARVIRPGDIVATRTLDSGGIDADGTMRALYGNPQTGPFYVAGAGPGDVVAVHIRRLALNRDWADSLDGLVTRAMVPGLASQMGGTGRRVRWRLDREAGTARLEEPPAGLKDFVVPVRPMLGGIGVAPDFGFAPFSTGDTGRFGGNIDFNGVVEGATVYLPVSQPGAMVFLGDGHALQGDGETTQWALETSLDVEFSVEVLTGRPMAGPRIEDAERITTIGQAGSLDEAVKLATLGMLQWLAQDYGLTLSEGSLVLGAAAQYRVVTLAGRNAGIALSLDKNALKDLPRR